MWWTTPSYTSLELEGALAGLGLVREDVPGMYAELDTVPDPGSDVEIAEVPVDDPCQSLPCRFCCLVEILRCPVDDSRR